MYRYALRHERIVLKYERAAFLTCCWGYGDISGSAALSPNGGYVLIIKSYHFPFHGTTLKNFKK